MKRTFLSLLCFCQVSVAAAQFCVAHETSEYVKNELSVHAEAVLAEAQRYFQGTVGLVRVLNASTQWEERGQMNFGVFEITAPGGESVVLKILDGEQFLARHPETQLLMDFDGELRSRGPSSVRASQFKEYVDLHAILGQMHTAPRLLAVFTASAFKQAAQSQWSFLETAATQLEFSTDWLTRSVRMGSQAVGVVMEKIPLPPEQGPLHPVSRPTKPHPFMQKWSAATVEQAVRDVIEIRRRVIIAGVALNDRQLAVTPSGRAYLIDLDQARFSAAVAPSLDVSPEIKKIISHWEESSGEVFDKQLEQNLLKEASKPYDVCRDDADLAQFFSDWRTCEEQL